MKTTDLSRIMSEAWRLFKVTGEAFAECLKKAWQLFKLAKAMRKGIAKFYFQKIDGSIRQAFGTLKEDVIADKIKGTERKSNVLLFTYWDTEKEAFRSFKRMNIISIA